MRTTDDSLSELITHLGRLHETPSVHPDAAGLSELRSECQAECRQIRSLVDRVEKAEAGNAATQDFESEERKAEIVDLKVRLDALEKEKDAGRDKDGKSKVAAGNYLLGSRGSEGWDAAVTPAKGSWLAEQRPTPPPSPTAGPLRGTPPLNSTLPPEYRRPSTAPSLLPMELPAPGASSSTTPSNSRHSNAKSGALPKAGEIWTFTGNVEILSVFSNSAADNKIHELACSLNSGGKLRRIEVLSTATEISQYVHFRGTQSLHWLEGWLAIYDENGRWNITKSDVHEKDNDCTFA